MQRINAGQKAGQIRCISASCMRKTQFSAMDRACACDCKPCDLLGGSLHAVSSALDTPLTTLPHLHFKCRNVPEPSTEELFVI